MVASADEPLVEAMRSARAEHERLVERYREAAANVLEAREARRAAEWAVQDAAVAAGDIGELLRVVSDPDMGRLSPAAERTLQAWARTFITEDLHVLEWVKTPVAAGGPTVLLPEIVLGVTKDADERAAALLRFLDAVSAHVPLPDVVTLSAEYDYASRHLQISRSDGSAALFDAPLFDGGPAEGAAVRPVLRSGSLAKVLTFRRRRRSLRSWLRSWLACWL